MIQTEPNEAEKESRGEPKDEEKHKINCLSRKKEEISVKSTR
jgi:hypothetical protein